MTQEQCLAFIGKLSQKSEDADDDQKLIKKGRSILERSLLPHIGTDSESFMRKAYFIGYMIHRLMKAYQGQASEDDRDHYGKKRLDMTGTLLVSLFKDQFRKKFVDEARKKIEKEISKQQKVQFKMDDMFDSLAMSKTIKYALSTGNWGSSKG